MTSEDFNNRLNLLTDSSLYHINIKIIFSLDINYYFFIIIELNTSIVSFEINLFKIIEK